MAYQSTLDGGATVTVENAGEQTRIWMEREGQSQGSGVTTGAWKAAPKLWRMRDGAVLEINGRDKTYFGISGGSVHSLDRAPDLSGAEPIELREVEDSGEGRMRPMAPMEPMKPLKPLGED